MSGYVFDKNAVDRELGRLRLIETAVDPDTIGLLKQTGLSTGCSSLELGAGAGSVVEWMGRRVGPQGRVVAIDRNITYLQRFSSPPYRVIEGDFLTVPIEYTVDLIHARYVLIHNKQEREMLDKIRALVRKGGYVVLEEPDFSSAKLLETGRDAAHQRVNDAICRMFTNAGLDPAYGLSLPRKMAEAGLNIVLTNSRLHLCSGGAPVANLMAESALVLRTDYTGTGMASDHDVERYVANAHDPRYWSVYYSTVSVMARVE